jgi:hypothetical protein
VCNSYRLLARFSDVEKYAHFILAHLTKRILCEQDKLIVKKRNNRESNFNISK